MMKNPVLISLIIPFYNVEKFIGACLESIFSQPDVQDKIEVICIDDCSPDNSRKIVEHFISKHANLRLIIHEVNKCLGGARNTGLMAANGQYVWFIDSDDLITSDSLNFLLEKISNFNQPDVVLFNFKKITILNELLDDVIVFPDHDVTDGISYVKEVFDAEMVYHLGYVWRMLINRKLLVENSWFFPEKSFWEDTVFMPKVIMMSDKVCSVSNPLYLYRVNPESVTGIFDKRYRADLIFQFAFNAGYDLKIFAKELMNKDEFCGKIMLNRADWYLNSFIINLLRAPAKEIKNFFRIIRSINPLMKPVIMEMRGIALFFVKYPFLGEFIIRIVAPLYKLNKKSKM